jgi:hypothetical protein
MAFYKNGSEKVDVKNRDVTGSPQTIGGYRWWNQKKACSGKLAALKRTSGPGQTALAGMREKSRQAPGQKTGTTGDTRRAAPPKQVRLAIKNVACGDGSANADRQEDKKKRRERKEDGQREQTEAWHSCGQTRIYRSQWFSCTDHKVQLKPLFLTWFLDFTTKIR